MTVPWLWLYGPPGVGKSATGFELFERLAERGERVGFVELDQLGMCLSAPVLARSEAKVHNLLGMLDTFASAGAEGVVVSGDLVEVLPEVLALARVRPVLCRLRADDEVTLERLRIRRSVHFAMPSSAYDAHDAPAPDLEVATHPLAVSDVAAEILRRLGPWPSPSASGSAAAAVASRLPAAAVVDAPTIVVTGPRAVGTSTVAWQVLMASLGAGRATGYLDLQQLGFVAPAVGEASSATMLANVATCWAGFRAQGTERLVLCGHVGGAGVDDLRAVVPSAVVVALSASPANVLERAGRRRRHKELWLPGDDLFGCGDAHLEEAVDDVRHFDAERADVVIGTDDVSPAEVAARIAGLWP